MGLHLGICAAAWMAASQLMRISVGTSADPVRATAVLPYLLLLRALCWHEARVARVYFAHVGLRDLIRLAASSAAATVLLLPLLAIRGESIGGLLPAALVLEYLLTTGGIAAVWAGVRWRHERRHSRSQDGATRALIIGAGDAGEQLLRQLLHDGRHALVVAGFVDDDAAKRDRCIHGVPVVGTIDDLRAVAAIHRATLALVAIPSITPEQIRRLVKRCREASLQMRLLPPLRHLIDRKFQVEDLREVRLEDLLGRAPVQLDLSAIARDLAGGAVAVTGAAGSIGSELVRQIAAFHPRVLILIDRAESPLHALHLAMAAAHPEVLFVPVLASVTNGARMEQVFRRYRPGFVYHAAAYKQLPMLETNVVEGLWNNAIGTLRTARCAARHGASRFVLVSTDKAVNPSSVLGLTKLLAERLILELPSLRAAATDFRVVRFGNVLGSEGSVVPLFAQQLAAGGPLTVTHPETRRYFMTIPEAVQLVLRASALPEAAGEVAVLEMGTQMRILDLAEQMIRLAGRVPYEDVAIEFTGLRPGEKVEEELVAPGEVATASSEAKIRIVTRARQADGDLARQLRHLTSLATRGDETALLRALAALTPDRHPELDASLEARVHAAGLPALRQAPTQRRRVAALAALGASNGHGSNGHGSNGHGTNGHAANGHATNGHLANGHATNDHASDGDNAIAARAAGASAEEASAQLLRLHVPLDSH